MALEYFSKQFRLYTDRTIHGGSSLRSRRIKGRGWGGGREFGGKKRRREGKGKGNACYKDPCWFISAVVGGRKILIG